MKERNFCLTNKSEKKSLARLLRARCEEDSREWLGKNDSMAKRKCEKQAQWRFTLFSEFLSSRARAQRQQQQETKGSGKERRLVDKERRNFPS
jgi:hypothetical protein